MNDKGLRVRECVNVVAQKIRACPDCNPREKRRLLFALRMNPFLQVAIAKQIRKLAMDQEGLTSDIKAGIDWENIPWEEMGDFIIRVLPVIIEAILLFI